jgi:hypothetical protein
MEHATLSVPVTDLREILRRSIIPVVTRLLGALLYASGLGLVLSRGTVEAHEWGIWEEDPGHDPEEFPGSQFPVTVPMLPQMLGRTPPLLDSDDGEGRGSWEA